jgi:hypothetical protein
MDTDLKLTQVTDEDVRYLEQELGQSPKPQHLGQMTEKLAFQKTASQRNQDIKLYDPACVYQVGDAVYKEYDEPLTVSSKSVEHFKGAVVLTVVHKSYYDLYQAEMLEVDYPGGGTFRKYIDYMKKTKTQVLLPSNQGGQNCEPGTLDRSQDPRLTEMPLTDRDFKALERNLKAELAKSAAFFSWNDHYHLSGNRVEIPDEKVKEVEALIAETGQSAGTESLVTKLFGLEPSSDRFDLHCLSLNYALDKKHKKDFVFVFPEGWGKWHLKKIYNALPNGLALAAPVAKLPKEAEKVAAAPAAGGAFPLKVYLTWREVQSGGVKVPRAQAKELSHALEYIFTEPEEGKSYPVYYFPKQSYFLGLGEYFAANNIPQGASLTLEKKSPTRINFWVKKSKKKMAIPKLAYDPAADLFTDTGEESFTLAEPNKILYLERDQVKRILDLYDKREGKDLLELLVLVFRTFSSEASHMSLHYQRAFQLVDILKQTYQEDVEKALLSSSEFTTSEKKKGIFFYEEPVEVQVPTEPERAEGEAPEAASQAEAAEGMEGEELPIGMTEEEYRERVPEVEVPEEPREIISLEPKPAPPEAVAAAQARAEVEVEVAKAAKPAKEKEAAAKKEKPAKKKKPKAEGEKLPKTRKSERRVIEEKIELEESEIEALDAVKAEKERIEAEEAASRTEAEVEAPAVPPAAKEKGKAPAAPAEAAKPAPPTFGGLFGEKLKSALKKKPEEKKGEEETDKK